MKKGIYYVLVCMVCLSIVSCKSNKKAETLNDLNAKYEGKTMKNCNSFIDAYSEIMDVYFATIDKAYEGDEAAFQELEEFEPLMASISEDGDKLKDECPEKFEKFGKELESKMTEYLPKLLSIIGNNMNMEGLENLDFDLDELDLENLNLDELGITE